MDKYNKAIVLGSGFSKALCDSTPLIKDIFKKLEQGSLLKGFIDEVKEELGDYYDVEGCISYILSREIFFNENENIKFYILRKELLRHIYNSIKNYKPEKEYMNIMKKFLLYCADNNILLITFNYDLFIEKICDYINEEDNEFEVNYGVQLKGSPYKHVKTVDADDLNKKHIELLKMHGSFNWFNMSENENANINDIIVADDKDMETFYRESIPFYVPMSSTKYKYLAGNMFKMLWRKMDYYINDVEELNFIGYGFPKTDYDNIIMFTKYKDKIRDIVVLCEEGNASDFRNKKRLEKVFSNARVHGDGAIKYISELVGE